MNRSFKSRASLRATFAAMALGLASTTALPTVALAQPMAAKPSETLNLSQGTGSLIRLSSPMSDLFIANDQIADVQVRSSTQLYVFGKSRGETTVYATDKSGRVVYAASVRVGNNTGSVSDMLHLAMPESQIQATPMNNLVLLTGTVASPEDASEAQRLAQAYVGDGTQIISRLKTATPLQVNLKVKIAEVNRSFIKEIGVNLLGGGNHLSIAQGEGIFLPPAGETSEQIGQIIRNPIGATIGATGKIFGMDMVGRLALAETDGLVTTLAEPNLTALSGETASFLAGGEFPVPVAETGLGGISVEFKEYGVSLAFTPIVLADGRISMRVRPEVSELTNEGSIKIGELFVPGLTTRRAETTVELGSGQSFMLAGLLRNSNANDISKAPFLGDLPILGTLFRSTKFRRAETELVIIVTPYLVRPVSTRMALPTDGYRAPTTPQMVFEGQTYTGTSGPRPSAVTPAPAVGVPVGGAAATTAAPGFKL